MKRILPLVLLLTLLLCACGKATVPTYSQPQTSEPPASEESTLPTEPSSDETEASLPTLGTAEALHTCPADASMVRFTRFNALEGDTIYEAYGFLCAYDMIENRAEVCCTKKHCPHADDNCNAYIAEDMNGYIFTVRDGTAYFIGGELNPRGDLTELKFFAIDIVTGERRTYYEPAPGGTCARIGDAALCGNVAVLSFDTFVPTEEGGVADTKTHRMLSFDLTSGEMTTVMQREISHGEMYNLWGLTETHLLVAYHYQSAPSFSYGAEFNPLSLKMDYSDYVASMNRWVMLEYPLTENPMWSAQVFGSSTSQTLYDYSQFYNGKLYYRVDDWVKSYDLETHTGKVLFEQPDIERMFCMDGSVFCETDEGRMRYELATGTVYQCPDSGERTKLMPFAETDDAFLCVRSYDGSDYFRIDKMDFYRGNFEAAEALPSLY